MNEPKEHLQPSLSCNEFAPKPYGLFVFSAFVRRHFKNLDPAVLAGSWLGILIACSGFALDYILNLALSQWLSPADFGDYSVAVSLAVFGGMIALLGTDQALMKFLPAYLQDKDWGRAKGVLSFSLLLVLCSGVAVSLLALLIVFMTTQNPTSHPSLIGLMVLPVVALALLTSKALRSFHHIFLSAAPINIALPLLVILGGYLLAQQDRISDWNIVAVYGGAFLSVLMVQIFVLVRHVKGDIFSAPAVYEKSEWSTTAFSLMIATVLFFAMEQMGLYMVELFASEEDVAIYAVLIKHARFLLIIFVAVNLSVMPFISPALKKNDQKEMQRLYGTSMHMVLWGGMIPLIIFVVAGEQLLLSFGPAYGIGYGSLLILMGAYFLNFVAGFSVPFLQFAGHRKLVNGSVAIALVLEMILFSLLVPDYGFKGAAWSMALTLSGLSLWLTFQSWRLLGLRPLRLSMGPEH